jgi:hypothetical protein
LNCGSCGTTCSTDTGVALCVLGHCVEREVIQPGAVKSPYGVAANATDVFWSDGNKVCQTAIESKEVTYFADDGHFPEVWGLGGILVTGFALDGDTLFWFGPRSEPLASGTVTTFAAESETFALNTSAVFWTDGYGISMAPRGGGDPSTLVSDTRWIASIAADESNVYWLGFGGLMSTPLEGGSITTLVPVANISPYERLAIDQDSLYWTTQFHDVRRVSKAGGVPVTLARGRASTELTYGEALVDDQYVYWATLDFYAHRSTIMRVPKAGGAPEVVLRAPAQGVTDFTLDPTGIDYIGYKTDDPAFTGVFRVPRFP